MRAMNQKNVVQNSKALWQGLDSYNNIAYNKNITMILLIALLFFFCISLAILAIKTLPEGLRILVHTFSGSKPPTTTMK